MSLQHGAGRAISGTMNEPLARILARLEVIKNERAKLDNEERDLQAAVRVLKRFGISVIPSAAFASGSSQVTGTSSTEIKPQTKAEMIVGILTSAEPPWMTGQAIREKFSAAKGEEVAMTALSPMLSKLKEDGVLVRRGLEVALASRVQNIEAPTSEPEEAP